MPNEQWSDPDDASVEQLEIDLKRQTAESHGTGGLDVALLHHLNSLPAEVRDELIQEYRTELAHQRAREVEE